MKIKKVICLMLVLMLMISVVIPCTSVLAEGEEYLSNFDVDLEDYSKWFDKHNNPIAEAEGENDANTWAFENGKIKVGGVGESAGAYVWTELYVNFDEVDHINYTVNVLGEGGIKFKDVDTGFEWQGYFSEKGPKEGDLIETTKAALEGQGISGERKIELQIHGYFEGMEISSLSFVSESAAKPTAKPEDTGSQKPTATNNSDSTNKPVDKPENNKTSDMSLALPLILAAAGALGGLNLRKRK